MNPPSEIPPRRQRFVVACPRASTITLVGDFTRWHQTPLFLEKGPDGLWAVQVDLPPGAYHFRLLVDQEPDHGMDDRFEVPEDTTSPPPIRRAL